MKQIILLTFFIFYIPVFADMELPIPRIEETEDSYDKEHHYNIDSNSFPNFEHNDEIKKEKTENSKESDKNENTKNLKESKIPHSDKIDKKGAKKGKSNDTSKSFYDRGVYGLHKNNIPVAEKEFEQAANNEGEFTDKAKLEQIRLFALNGNKQAALSIIDGWEGNIDLKYKGIYELAIGLDSNSKGESKNNKEDAYIYYLKIVTELPPDHPILPKTLWSISHLLFRNKEFKSALDNLSQIIEKFKNTEYYDDALYLTGRIYETGNREIKNIERARAFYSAFLKNINEPYFKDSIYKEEVIKRKEKLASL